MNSEDFEKFSIRWAAMVDMQNGGRRSDEAISMAFEVLQDFDLDQVCKAIMAHCRVNSWVAAPKDIIDRIVGVRPAIEAMMGLARSADTPLGLFISQKIGGHEMQTYNDSQMHMRMKQLQPDIQDFIDRVHKGQFTDLEIRMFAGRRMDPTGKLCRGLRGPASQYVDAVWSRYQSELKPAIEQDKNPEPSEVDQEAGKAALSRNNENA